MSTNGTVTANGPPAKRQRVNAAGITANPPSVRPTQKFQPGDKVHVDNILPAFTKIEMKVLRASNARTGSWEYVLDSTIIPDYESTIVVPENRVFQVKYPIGTEVAFRMPPAFAWAHSENSSGKVKDWRVSDGQVLYDVKVGCVWETYKVGDECDLTLKGLGTFKGKVTEDTELTFDIGVVQVSEAELDAKRGERQDLSGSYLSA
jgi:hypothetical protein